MIVQGGGAGGRLLVVRFRQEARLGHALSGGLAGRMANRWRGKQRASRCGRHWVALGALSLELGKQTRLRLRLRVLGLGFAHGYPFAQVADGGVLEQGGKDHYETGAQEYVDRFDVGDLGQGGVSARH